MNNSNGRGLNGLLDGKQSLDQQIDKSLADANKAMQILKVSMAFKTDLDAAVNQFNQRMDELTRPAKTTLDDEPSVQEIMAEYKQKKERT